MWWMFKSAFVRKLAYIAAALVVAQLLGHRAHATTYTWTATCASSCSPGSVFGPFDSPYLAVAAVATYCAGLSGKCGCVGNTAFTPHVTAGTFPTYSGTVTGTTNGCGYNPTVTAAAVSSPTVCPTPGQGTLFGLAALSSDGNQCFNGCQYTHPGTSLTVKCGPGSGAGCSGGEGLVEASSTGQSCASSAATTPVAAGASPDLQPQVTDTSGKLGTAVNPVNPGEQCGTVNGDEVCISAVKNGSCVSYASGGVACAEPTGTSVVAPPAPDNGTATVPATADATVAANGNTVNYYGGGTVAGSHGAATPTNPTNGQPIGTAGTGTGIGACVPSAPGVTPVVTCGTGSTAGGASAGNGDCGASGVDCAADGGVPSLSRSDTIQSNVQGYMDAIAAAPIVTAMSAIAGSWPTASCPTVPFTLSMFSSSSSFDAMAPVCTIWGTTVAPTLSLVFLAMWAVAGIRVVLSA